MSAATYLGCFLAYDRTTIDIAAQVCGRCRKSSRNRKKVWMVSVSDQRISRRTSPTRRADVFLLDVFLIQPMSSMHRHSACSFPATSPAIDSSKSHKNELLCFLRFRSHPFAGRQLHFLLGLCPVVELHRRSGQCRRTIDSAK